MDPLSIIAIAEAAAKATSAAVALYQQTKDTMSSNDRAKVEAALTSIATSNDTETVAVLARLDALAKS